MPKKMGVGRLLTVLGDVDGRAYEEAVARVAPRIERALGPRVVANRALSGNGRLAFEPWAAARRRFRRQLERHEARRRDAVAVLADVRDCYASIEPGVVGERLLRVGCHPNEVGSVLKLLERFQQQGVPGLPVGPGPSAVLANAVLASADRALAREGVHHLRWVDDFVAFVPDQRRARQVLERLEETLAAHGLSLAHEKTLVLEGGQGIRSALGIREVSATYLG